VQHQPLVLTEPPPSSLVPHSRKESLLTLLQHIHTYPTAIQSDLSRGCAQEIAEAASRGYISTLVIPGERTYGRVWKITHTGIMFLTNNAACIAKDELAAYNAQR
jgi:hypothetical protein